MKMAMLKFFSVVLFSLAFGCALCLAVSPVNAQQDITPPVLLNVQFSPSQIDTSKGPATITVTVHVTDDLSGVDRVSLHFRKPGTTQTASASFKYIVWEGPRVPLLDGNLTARLKLPKYAAYGEWEMYSVTLEDNVGNSIHFSKPQDADDDFVDDDWPSIYNGFDFAVAESPQQPARQLYIPSLSVQ